MTIATALAQSSNVLLIANLLAILCRDPRPSRRLKPARWVDDLIPAPRRTRRSAPSLTALPCSRHGALHRRTGCECGFQRLWLWASRTTVTAPDRSQDCQREQGYGEAASLVSDHADQSGRDGGADMRQRVDGGNAGSRRTGRKPAGHKCPERPLDRLVPNQGEAQQCQHDPNRATEAHGRKTGRRQGQGKGGVPRTLAGSVRAPAPDNHGDTGQAVRDRPRSDVSRLES